VCPSFYLLSKATTLELTYSPHQKPTSLSNKTKNFFCPLNKYYKCVLKIYWHYEDRWDWRHKFYMYFIQPKRCNLYSVLYYYYLLSTCFGWFFRPSSGAYKTVCATLGIVMLSCCLPLVWMGWNRPKLVERW